MKGREVNELRKKVAELQKENQRMRRSLGIVLRKCGEDDALPNAIRILLYAREQWLFEGDD